MVGLIHPESMELWREWASSHGLLRRGARSLLRAGRTVTGAGSEPGDPAWVLHSRDGDVRERLLIALDDSTSATRAGLLSTLAYLRTGIDVLAPAGLQWPELAGDDWTRIPFDSPRDAAQMGTAGVVSTGQDRPAGAAAHVIATRRDIPEFVVQTGPLTPYAAPLPHGARLLAWNEADAEFWRSGRPDVRALDAGSQLLWAAAHEGATDPQPTADPAAADHTEPHGPDTDVPETDPSGTDPSGADGPAADSSEPADPADTERGAGTSTLVFLGQLASAEIGNRRAAAAASAFCREHGAAYLPGAGETGLEARILQRRWKRAGIEILPADTSVQTPGRDLVSILAIDVLEKAARGGNAWVYCPEPPAWIHDFWARYRMRTYPGPPTPAPVTPDAEPAATFAQLIENEL